MKLGTLLWVAVIGAAVLAALNARDIERYIRLRSM
jgi:hypothetical protein